MGLTTEIQRSRKWVSKYCSSCGAKLYFPGTVNSIIAPCGIILSYTWEHGSKDGDISNPRDRRSLQGAAVRVWRFWGAGDVVSFPAGSLRFCSLELPVSSASSDALVKMRPLGSVSEGASLKICLILNLGQPIDSHMIPATPKTYWHPHSS